LANHDNEYLILRRELPCPPASLLDGMDPKNDTSELQSPVPISYAVFCLKKKNK